MTQPVRCVPLLTNSTVIQRRLSAAAPARDQTKMTPGRREALLLFLALAGCRSTNPNLYSLVVPPGPTLPGGPRVVALRDVSLAGYLDRLQIVRSSENYQLTISENDWWGEPLSG